MNPSKCDLGLYVRFLCVAEKSHSCVELSGVSSYDMAHDAINRMLNREDLSPDDVWVSAKEQVDMKSGFLVVDDTVLDKPYANKIELVRWQYSGLHHDVVKGIGLITMLWTDGEKHVPLDFRVYDPNSDGKTKNDHFLDMVNAALKRGFQPECFMFDSWYSSLTNLKHLRKLGLEWFCQLKKNRIVNRGDQIGGLDIGEDGLVVHLRGYGWIRVFQSVTRNGAVKYYATGKYDMSKQEYENKKKTRWRIEGYHRGLKQHTGVSRCQLRSKKAQKNHITASILAFLKLEITRIKKAISWAQQKLNISRVAITRYLTYNIANA